MNPILKVSELDKAFIGVHAVDHVSFECLPGKVHVLQGENGAGKSTILKMLTGMYRPDSGEIYINGNQVKIDNPLEAQKKGISMVYQGLTLLPNLTVAENIFLNREHTVSPKRLLDETAMIRETMKLSEKYNIEADPYMLAGDMPIAACQMVELLKALTSDPDVLILDEPTSTLNKNEVAKLFSIVRDLTEKGKAVIFISHRMEEVMDIGDTMTIMKDGQLVKNVNIADVTENDIISMMVGREFKDFFPPKSPKISDEVLFKMEDLTDKKKFFDINLELRKGEVVGIAALDGQGQTELLQALAGVRHRAGGKIYLNGQELNYNRPIKAIKNGIGYVPEDRKNMGLCLSLSVRENIALSSLKLRSRMGFVDKPAEDKVVDRMIQVMNIKTPSPAYAVGNLSGGNQQKVSIGKALAADPRVILLNEPTRGIDVDAKQEIYKLIRGLANQGVAVLIYSSDMMEIIGLCDRVLTFYEGRLTYEMTGDDINEENIMYGQMNLQPADKNK